MNTGSLTLDFFLLMLIVYKPCLYGNEAENCSIDVTIKRETKISSISGDSVTIECPVKYCHKQPKVNWLKYNARLQDFFILHTGQNHNESWINGNIFVLKFPYINRNDSGLYRCEATLEGNTTAGHAIEVVVQVKNKTTSSTLEIEMNEVCDYKNVKYCSDATSHVSNEGSVPPLQLFPDDSATHNNLSICKKSNRTASKPTCDKSVTNQLLPTNQDILVYATLNHKEYFQGSNLFVETDFTEYAAIMVKT
ncbi:B- and T-lymphocyte attenuator isoform X3 [Anolis carolinensis]|uniref:B- and T-lymphocyte attenuator isoform X3 n=1 Tax=Anolis carolinensis TaxID=28377 RepID=UPI00046287B6|nr:PREDICTED: B- and T-lymphocyte attenuator isoform X3 [Anolis carolinensis]|eukprot:XP_008105958.1 PREDICTED: B- and T-lymphocyte attenuator isoform X3 [Anolis carolinensis]